MTATGELRIDGQPGESSRVEVYYRTAPEAGFGGVGDRILVGDDAGAVAAGDLCAVISTGDVSCDARPVGSIAARDGRRQRHCPHQRRNHGLTSRGLSACRCAAARATTCSGAGSATS